MRPVREGVKHTGYSYFISTQTAGRQPFFRHERWARLLLSTLKHYDETAYCLHAYVVMPDHLHLLITPFDTAEKAVQLIKGGFSFRARREFNWPGDIWQQGFTDHRIRDEEDWCNHIEYIRLNPVRARLVVPETTYEFIGFPGKNFPQGLKPADKDAAHVRTEVRTLRTEEISH